MTRSTHAAGPAAAQPHLTRLLLMGLLLLAFALRSFHLDFQSLWSDEGISLRRASLPLGRMIESMPVEHPPGYFVALHGWQALTGDHDFGLRYFSLIASVLAVALLARMGYELGTRSRRTVALVAASLLATSAFQVWYAQEARMYAWLLAASLASTLALWKMLQQKHRRWWWTLLYAASTAACVYLHYFGALVPVAHVLFVAGWGAVHRDRSALVAWLAGAAASLLLFLPWLPRALQIAGFEGWREPGSASEIPLRYLSAYTLSDAMPELLKGWLPWLYLALLGAGTVWWLVRRRSAGALLLTMVLAPLGMVLLLALRSPDYHERYAIALTGPLALLVAGGIVGLAGSWAARKERLVSTARQTGAFLILVVLLGSNGAALFRHYTDSSLHKPDFRSAAQTIMAGQRPGDVILIDGPDPNLVFSHYYTGGLPVFDLRGLEHADLVTVGERMAPALAGASRAWELLYFHDPAAVQVWLATQAWATEPSFHNNIRVTLYGVGQASGDPRSQEVAFGDALTLRQSLVTPTSVRPGDLLRVTTDWLTQATPPEYRFSLRLIDGAGAAVVAQDYVPQNWFAPTPTWIVGQPARDQRGLLIPQGLAPGAYTVALRLYDPATAIPVNTSQGDDLTLATIEVLP